MKAIALFCLTALTGILFSGCKTTYQDAGFTGGYTESQLDKNVFKVSFNGNAFTSLHRATDFTLLRSAELTLINGFRYFVIIEEDSRIENTTGSTGTTGQTYNYSKPRASNTIVCFEEKPESGFSYDAAFIKESLMKKHKIKQK